jgi:uncharacterized protein (TIGR02391 family)
MILTDKEMGQVRRALEAQAGLDEELARRCGHLIHLGAFDEAVRSAFVLLEERLRKAVGEERMTGTQLANFAFNPAKGPLSQQLGHSRSEKEGLRELYSGAFKLFRNPTAHGVVEYSAAEGKAIIALVDLLLRMLKRAEELPPPGLLPENVEGALEKVEEAIGAGATSRLHGFLARCVSELGLRTTTTAKEGFPFRRHALYKAGWWDEPKSHPVPAFYLLVSTKRIGVQVPVNQYHAAIEGFDTDSLTDELMGLGFHPQGRHQAPTADLRIHNDGDFFDALFDIVSWVTDEFEESLK